MNKKVTYTIISLLILVVAILSGICFKKHKETQENQAKIASENIADWSMIYEMTKTVDESFVQNTDWREVDTLDWYVTGVTSHTVSGTKPLISGGSTETARIMTTRYSSVFRELTGDRIPDMYKDELFQIFSEMNTELYNICSYVMNTCESDTEKQVELITEDSDLYKKVSKDLKEFCQKYEKKYNDYFKKFNF